MSSSCGATGSGTRPPGPSASPRGSKRLATTGSVSGLALAADEAQLLDAVAGSGLLVV
jgi:hypothetical protein